MNSKNLKTPFTIMEVLSKHCSGTENDETQNDDSDLSGLEDLEEVFADHMLMEKRLRKRLYAGDFADLKELPDHPPIALTGLALELFSKAVPNYGLDILDMDYVASASEAARISPCAMILAMIYLERLQVNNSDYLEAASPSGLFVVTMLVASKFLFEDNDDLVTNQMWAEALNLDVKDLNHLEYEFLSAIDWKVYIDSSDFFSYLSDVERVVACKQSAHRGWLTFSDICVIAEHNIFNGFWTRLIKRIAKMTLLSAFGYIATALALQGSGIALQSYMKPTKSSSQSMVKETQNLNPTPPGDMQHINKSPILETSFIDEIGSESDPVTVNIFITEQDSESYEAPKGTYQRCHPYSKFREPSRPLIVNTHGWNYYLTERQNAHYSNHENLNNDASVKTNYTFGNVSWDKAYCGGHSLCLFMRIKQCY